jgi:hypothetical protein
MTILRSTATAHATATASASARVKHSFSRQHLVGARHLAELASAIEKNGASTEQEKTHHRAYVSGAVIFSVAFLEASINELYLEAIDKNANALSGLTPPQIEILAELWETTEQHSVLGKYQVALAACGKSRFEKGLEPYQAADGLVKVRNALIHYRPEWDDELEEHKKLYERLNGRFPLNTLAAAGSLWFPHLCMGAGCAQWATEQAANFATEFCARMDIPNRTP